jgi:hypothetical protein
MSVKGLEVAHQIFAHKEYMFTTSIMFNYSVVCLSLHCYVLCHCLLVLYLFISRLLFGFLIIFISLNISLQQCTCIMFIKPFFFVFINIYLQQSTCMMFISCVVGFTFSCCLLLSSCSLLVHFPYCCLGS